MFLFTVGARGFFQSASGCRESELRLTSETKKNISTHNGSSTLLPRVEFRFWTLSLIGFPTLFQTIPSKSKVMYNTILMYRRNRENRFSAQVICQYYYITHQAFMARPLFVTKRENHVVPTVWSLGPKGFLCSRCSNRIEPQSATSGGDYSLAALAARCHRLVTQFWILLDEKRRKKTSWTRVTVWQAHGHSLRRIKKSLGCSR